MIATKTSRQQSPTFWVFTILIILLAVAVRLVAITSLPLFVDESQHILRAYRVMDGELFVGLEHQKWLFTAVLAVFRARGPESVWVARTLSVLCSVVTVATAIALGRLLGRRVGGADAAGRIGLAAGLMYALLPMTVFHERQALVDPMMVAFTGLATLLAMRLARRPQLVTALLLGLVLGGAVLTKVSALPYLGLPLVASLLLARRRDAFWRSLALGSAAAAGAGGAVWLAYRLAERSGAAILPSHRITYENTMLGSLTNPDTLVEIEANVRYVGEALVEYVGPVILVLVALAVVWLIRRMAWRELLFLGVPAVVFAGTLVVFRQVTGQGYLPPRYLLPNTLPIAAIAAFSLHCLLKYVSRLRRGAAPWVGAGLMAAILVPAIRFDVVLIRDPINTPFTSVDASQYLANYDSFGVQAAAQVLLDEWRANGQPHFGVIGLKNGLHALRAYIGPDLADFRDRSRGNVEVANTIVPWMADGMPIYIVEDIPGNSPVQLTFRDALAENFDDLLLEDMGIYGGQRVARVTGVRGPLSDRIYARLAGEPGFMAADFEALAAELAADPTPRTAVVFPASHALSLVPHTDLVVLPLSPGVWPVTPEAVTAALRPLNQWPDASPVEVVFVRQQETDANGTVAVAVQRALYYTGVESWAGVLTRRQFVTGPTNAALAPLATFEDAIHLSAALVDQQAQPGSALRIALRWESDVPVQDSFKVFAHVVDASGTLWAQHDSIPGGGLLPTTGWPPGQPVDDHLAIMLPSDLPPGEYEVYLGLYHPDSGLRLRVTGGAQAGGDTAVLGRLSIAGPDG